MQKHPILQIAAMGAYRVQWIGGIMNLCIYAINKYKQLQWLNHSLHRHQSMK
jgi:hypothetical protein